MAKPLAHGNFCSTECRSNARKGFHIAKAILDLPDNHPGKWELEAMGESFVLIFTNHELTVRKAGEAFQRWEDNSEKYVQTMTDEEILTWALEDQSQN